MLICCNRGHFFLTFLSPRATLLAPDWSRGENTCSWLAEHASSTFVGFFSLCPKTTSSFRFFGIRFVPKIHKKNQVLHLETKFISLTRNGKRLFVSKAKILDRIDILVDKLKSVMATKYFHFATSSSSDNRAKQCPFDGRKEQVKIKGRSYYASSFFGSTVCYRLSICVRACDF